MKTNTRPPYLVEIPCDGIFRIAEYNTCPPKIMMTVDNLHDDEFFKLDVRDSDHITVLGPRLIPTAKFIKINSCGVDNDIIPFESRGGLYPASQFGYDADVVGNKASFILAATIEDYNSNIHNVRLKFIADIPNAVMIKYQTAVSKFNSGADYYITEADNFIKFIKGQKIT